jgi:UDP-N-acetylmuramoyl-tripeptide--D-alanyl-D-alanine ligase
MQLQELAAAVGGLVAGFDEQVTVRRVCVHSGDAGPGAVFFALAGSATDGHRFVGDAFGRGTAAAVVRHPGRWPGPVIVVRDPGAALLDLAAARRREIAATCVGITGSTGKTTTKDLIAAVLARSFRVHASPASFNNQVGVPLTILGAPADAEALVCEIGAGVVGEIAGLCRVAAPVVGVVTNVGSAHLGTFGSRRAIARAKGELVEALPRDGVAVLNADDPVVAGFRTRTAAHVVTFGRSDGADVRAERVELDACARASFVLVSGQDRRRVALGLVGAHMVPNALAAAACGIALGLDIDDSAAGLGSIRAAAGRMCVFELANGVRVLDDTYNANPESTAAGLLAARRLAGPARCVAVLGEMAELGPAAPVEHRRIGRIAARLGIDRLVLLGRHARDVARGAFDGGMPSPQVEVTSGLRDAAAAALAAARPGDVVFVKASRAAGLERLVALLGEPAPAGVGAERQSADVV